MRRCDRLLMQKGGEKGIETFPSQANFGWSFGWVCCLRPSRDRTEINEMASERVSLAKLLLGNCCRRERERRMEKNFNFNVGKGEKHLTTAARLHDISSLWCELFYFVTLHVALSHCEKDIPEQTTNWGGIRCKVKWEMARTSFSRSLFFFFILFIFHLAESCAVRKVTEFGS